MGVESFSIDTSVVSTTERVNEKERSECENDEGVDRLKKTGLIKPNGRLEADEMTFMVRPTYFFTTKFSHFLYGKPNFFPDFDHTYVGISIALIAK